MPVLTICQPPACRSALFVFWRRNVRLARERFIRDYAFPKGLLRAPRQTPAGACPERSGAGGARLAAVLSRLPCARAGRLSRCPRRSSMTSGTSSFSTPRATMPSVARPSAASCTTRRPWCWARNSRTTRACAAAGTGAAARRTSTRSIRPACRCCLHSIQSWGLPMDSSTRRTARRWRPARAERHTVARDLGSGAGSRWRLGR